MININLINTTDFNLNVEEKFVYNFYNKKEKILDDNIILNNNISPDSFIELSINFGKKYDQRFQNYIQYVDLEEFKNISGKKLTSSDLEYFNKLHKFNNHLNLNIDRPESDFKKISKYYNIKNSEFSDAKSFLSKNLKINVNNKFKNEFMNSNKDEIFFTKTIENAIENFDAINKNSDEILSEEKVKISEGFKVYSKKSAHTNTLTPYYIQIGNLIEKYKIIDNEKILCDTRFYFSNRIQNYNNSGASTFSDTLNIKDNAVKYGSSYLYAVYPTYITTQPSKSDYHILDTFILCDYPYITKEILCKEFKRPIPPAKLFFKYNEIKKHLKISWSKPLEKQGDIKGYQIFKRSNLKEPFKLIKQIEFHNETDAYDRNENVPLSSIETPRFHKNYFLDNDFMPDRVQIYAICSIDAHGYTSNYSEQLGVVYDFQRKKCMIDLVSRVGAPLHMPNILVARKTRFFDNDDNIVSITPIEKNVSKFTLYLTPEYFEVADYSSEDIKLFNDKYKFSIYKLENGETFISDLEIKNFT